MGIRQRDAKCDLRVQCLDGVVYCESEVLFRGCSAECVNGIKKSKNKFWISVECDVFLNLLMMLCRGRVSFSMSQFSAFLSLCVACDIDWRKWNFQCRGGCSRIFLFGKLLTEIVCFRWCDVCGWW
jgi:uncharacterized linocin/CFP29 family protein